jgi:uncharacterized membrane protein
MEADGRAEQPTTDHDGLQSPPTSEPDGGLDLAQSPFFRFVFPFVAIGLFWGMLVILVPDVRVALGHGDLGTFTAERVYCTKGRGGVCKWQGDFIAADGGTRRNDVLITGIGLRDLKRGGSVHAIDVGASSDVYSRKARYEWIAPLVGLLVALAMMLISFTGWRSWFRARRLARSR